MKKLISRYSIAIYASILGLVYEIINGLILFGLTEDFLLLVYIYIFVNILWLAGMIVIWNALSGILNRVAHYSRIVGIFFVFSILFSFLCFFIEITLEKMVMMKLDFTSHFYDDLLFYIPYFFTVGVVSFLLNAIMISKEIFENAKRKSIENETIAKENAIARYEVLRNQVNPHFLFNSLNTLSGLMFRDVETTQSFVKQLSKVYRYVLEQKENDVVRLATEIKFMESYIYMLAIRFQDALKVDISIPETAREQGFLPLSLQIVVENAVKHNVVSKKRPLTIEIGSETDYLWIKNNVQPRGTLESSTKTGLTNIIQRYQFLTIRPVIVEESEDFYLVKLPLLDR